MISHWLNECNVWLWAKACKRPGAVEIGDIEPKGIEVSAFVDSLEQLANAGGQEDEREIQYFKRH